MHFIARKTTIDCIHIMIQTTVDNLRYLVTHYIKRMFITIDVIEDIRVPFMPWKRILLLRTPPLAPPPRFPRPFSFNLNDHPYTVMQKISTPQEGAYFELITQLQG
jgi:hypothetical protein